MGNPKRVGQDVPDWAPVRRLPTEDETRARAKKAPGCLPVVAVVGSVGMLACLQVGRLMVG